MALHCFEQSKTVANYLAINASLVI